MNHEHRSPLQRRLDSRQKFFAVLDAISQYVESGKHGSLSQRDAAKSLLDELQSVIS